MASACITIEDEPTGGDRATVALKLIFSGGFKAESPAHQAAQALLKLWDREMGLGKIGEPVIDPIVLTPDVQLAVPEGAEATPVAEASRIVLETN